MAARLPDSSPHSAFLGDARSPRRNWLSRHRVGWSSGHRRFTRATPVNISAAGAVSTSVRQASIATRLLFLGVRPIQLRFPWREANVIRYPLPYYEYILVFEFAKPFAQGVWDQDLRAQEECRSVGMVVGPDSRPRTLHFLGRRLLCHAPSRTTERCAPHGADTIPRDLTVQIGSSHLYADFSLDQSSSTLGLVPPWCQA